MHLVITLDHSFDWTTLHPSLFFLFPFTRTSYLGSSFVCVYSLLFFLSLSLFFFFLFPLKGEQGIVNSPSSDILENLYLADPDTTIQFQAGLYYYQLNFKGTHFKCSYLQINCFTKINLQAIPAFQSYDLLY